MVPAAELHEVEVRAEAAELCLGAFEADLPQSGLEEWPLLMPAVA